MNYTRLTNAALHLTPGHGYDWIRGTDPSAQPRIILQDVASKQDIIMMKETSTGQSMLRTLAFLWADVGYFPEQGNFGAVFPIETFFTMLMLEHGVHTIDRDLPRAGMIMPRSL